MITMRSVFIVLLGLVCSALAEEHSRGGMTYLCDPFVPRQVGVNYTERTDTNIVITVREKDSPNSAVAQNVTLNKVYIVQMKDSSQRSAAFCHFSLKPKWSDPGQAAQVEFYEGSTPAALRQICNTQAVRDQAWERITDLQIDFSLRGGQEGATFHFEANFFPCDSEPNIYYKIRSGIYHLQFPKYAYVETEEDEEEEVEVEKPPKADDHELEKENEMAIKAQKALQDSIAAENLQSEGDWQKKQVEEEREQEELIHWEMEQFEMQQAEEENRRMERIRAEILDAEEHEEIEPEEDKDDEEDDDNVIDVDDDDDEDPKAAGATSIVISVATISAAIAAIIL